jgi:hypothetical protein
MLRTIGTFEAAAEEAGGTRLLEPVSDSVGALGPAHGGSRTVLPFVLEGHVDWIAQYFFAMVRSKTPTLQH